MQGLAYFMEAVLNAAIGYQALHLLHPGDALLTRSRGGPGHRTLRWTRASEQAGKALRSQGHQCAHVM